MSENADNIVNDELDFNDDLDDRLKDAEALANEIEEKINIESPEMLNVDMPSFDPPKPKEKMTKAKIIDKIMLLQKELNLDSPRPESHFKKVNKAECEEYLAWLVNKGVNKVQGTDDRIRNQTDVTASEEPDPVAKTSKEWGAKGLFQFNLILCKVAELSTANFKEKLGTDLIGLCDDVQENREELTEILADIYQEHGDSIGEYLTPLNRYFLLMSTLGANRAMINKKRVEQELEKK